MSVAVAPALYAAALLLALAGLVKVRDPMPTAHVLATSGLPHRVWLVRFLGLFELLIGIGSLGVARWEVRISLGVLYSLFGGFLGYVLIKRVPLTTCGCAGREQTPPSWLHVVLNVGAAMVAALAAQSGTAGIRTLILHLRFAAGPFLLGTLMLAYLLYMAVALLPRLSVLDGAAPTSQT